MHWELKNDATEFNKKYKTSQNSVADDNEATLKMRLDLINLLLPQLGLLTPGWWTIFLNKAWRWSDIGLTRQLSSEK